MIQFFTTHPQILDHMIRGLTTFLLIGLYLVYLRFIKLRLLEMRSKEKVNQKYWMIMANIGDIIILFAIVPKAADHIMTIFK